MPVRRLSSALTALAFSSLVATVRAEVAYTNLGENGAFDADSAWTVSTATSATGYQSFAQRFTSASSGRLSSIEIAGSYGDGAGTARAALFSDVGGSLGGSLETFDVDFSDAGGSGRLFVLSSVGGVSLSAGASYWVGLFAKDDSWIGWNHAAPTTTGTVAFDFDSSGSGVATDRLGAMRVTVQTVPEPTSMVAFALGSAFVARRRRLGRSCA